MKKEESKTRKYEVPQIEIIRISCDVILASGMATEITNDEGGKDYAVDWRW